MRRYLRFRLKIRTLAVGVGLVAAAGFSGAAAAEQRPGYYPEIEAELAMIEGSNGVEGVSAPDGYQPQLQGGAPLVIREAPDGSQPQLHRGESGTTTVRDGGGSFVWSNIAVGVSLGVVLAAAAALALGLTRGRMRVAHS